MTFRAKSTSSAESSTGCVGVPFLDLERWCRGGWMRLATICTSSLLFTSKILNLREYDPEISCLSQAPVCECQRFRKVALVDSMYQW